MVSLFTLITISGFQSPEINFHIGEREKTEDPEIKSSDTFESDDKKRKFESAQSPETIILAFGTLAGSVYTLFFVLYLITFNCREWRNVWRQEHQENRVDAEERYRT